MTEILQTYVPVMPLLVDVENAFVQPWVQGYYPSPFRRYFQYLDIEPGAKSSAEPHLGTMLFLPAKSARCASPSSTCRR